ncbi:MAG TPA: polyamine aminopropyltransferase [Syntrophomonadaceae bacterium]|nr:polyamine aminopropyltransferase [Syntrophomonadaceae bacterium]HQE23425.1 polyamine aminopropyltransferase [Syntrophomonadaceae bacterium]
MSNFWIYESHTPGYEVRWRITNILHQETTPYQKLAVVETTEWGKALILDGALQISERDEFIYHEMIAHVPMLSHPQPNRVLIIGGGDGGTLREVARHPELQSVDMVEIDERVIEASKRFFPQVASSFTDKRLNLYIADGIEFARGNHGPYDVIIVDSSDPVGPAEPLFTVDFYRDLYNLMDEDGMVVVQSESPLFFADYFKNVYSNLKSVFQLVQVYTATIPTYVSGPWSFTVGSKKHRADGIAEGRSIPGPMKYYNSSIHKAAFALPEYIRQMLE